MSGAVLQRCAACGHVQYPPRACCEACLADRLCVESAAGAQGRLLARTVLHHSQEERFRARLPLGVGLVQLDAGPIVLCFAPCAHAIGDRVVLRILADGKREVLSTDGTDWTDGAR